MSHLVIPGQVIAVSKQGDDEAASFLRGHGTYLERTDEGQERLIAAVTGTVQRVNKLISVTAVSDTVYEGNVGDLVVGRITAVTATRWKVALTPHGLPAALPLSGVHLPGGVQRVRTSQDARDMRSYLQEGDLVSAEVHKVQNDGSLLLHTRSFRYGKLENGCVVTVPPGRLPRRKNHYTTVLGQFQVLLGCNGAIWLQRKMPESSDNDNTLGGPELAELQEERRAQHVREPYTPEDRTNLARLRNSIECLRLTYGEVTTESIEEVYRASLGIRPSQMLQPEEAIRVTAGTRSG